MEQEHHILAVILLWHVTVYKYSKVIQSIRLACSCHSMILNLCQPLLAPRIKCKLPIWPVNLACASPCLALQPHFFSLCYDSLCSIHTEVLSVPLASYPLYNHKLLHTRCCIYLPFFSCLALPISVKAISFFLENASLLSITILAYFLPRTHRLGSCHEGSAILIVISLHLTYSLVPLLRLLCGFIQLDLTYSNDRTLNK